MYCEENDAEENGALVTGTIVGIAVGGSVFVSLIVIVILLFKCNRLFCFKVKTNQ